MQIWRLTDAYQTIHVDPGLDFITAAFSSGVATAQEEAGDAQPLRIGFLTFMGDAFFAGISEGADTQVQALNDSGDYDIQLLVNDTANDPAREAQLIDTFITQQVDAIVLSPLSETASVAAIKAASEAGIPVICYNTCLSAEDTEAYVKGFVSTGQKLLGTQTGEYAAEWIAENLDGNATIGILNCDVFEVCKERKAGFQEALADLPGVTYVADQEGWTSDKSAGVAQAVLTGNPDINVMWAANQLGVEGEMAAVKNLGLEGKVFLFGTDISPLIAQALLSPDNVVQVTTGQSPKEMGAIALQDAVDAANGMTIEPSLQIMHRTHFHAG